MHPSQIRFLSAVFLCVLLADGASADLGKLDPRARAGLARLRAGEPVAQLLDRKMAVSSEGDLDVFVRGPVTREALESAGAKVRTALPGLFTAFVPPRAIDAVAALPGVRSIRGSAPIELDLDASVPTTGVNVLRGAGPDFSGLNGAGVLIGDVDTGVDYGHGDFDDPAGHTRLVRIWDQTGSGNPPPPIYGYGAEWYGAQIDADLCTEVDASGHGTHVLGIAGGDGSRSGGSVPAYTYVGMAPKADLVMVKTNFQTTGVLDGVKYCFDLATARGQSAVVNLSLGSYFGPHDGTSDFEAGLSALTGPGRIVVKSAGNGRGTARHAEAIGAANVTTSVTGSDVGGMVAIDGYYESTENLSVKVTTPDGAVVGPIARGAAAGPYPGPPTPSGEVYLENGLSVTSTGDFEVYIEINVEAGQDMDGTWTITFTPVALGPAHGEVDLWRFATTSGSVVADFVVGNQPTEELITEPGNAVELITVAAWVSKDRWIDCNGSTTGFQTGSPGNLAPFSSPGPTRDGRQKPDIAAPGTAIGSSTSFDIPQSCSPGGSTLLPDGLSHVMSQGTSMAAPHVAGAAAILMQRYGAMTPSQLKSFLATHAKTDGFTGPVWNKDWGYGKLFIDFRPIAAAGGWPLTAFSLSPIAPNPARGPVHIDYAVTGEARVRLSVLDVRGREVARLANGVHRPGRYRVTWSGERAGEMAPAGLYFVCLKVPEGALVRRVVIAR